MYFEKNAKKYYFSPIFLIKVILYLVQGHILSETKVSSQPKQCTTNLRIPTLSMVQSGQAISAPPPPP